jgi:hypothetical protein
MRISPILLLSMVVLTPGVAFVASQQSSAAGTVLLDRLMWALDTNGQNVNWNTATEHCRNLRLGGYADWRLPTIDELQSLYDGSVTSGYQIKKPIQLKACCLWSSTILKEDGDARRRFEPSRYAWGLVFESGGIRYYSTMGFNDGQALCVRSAAGAK